MMMKYTPSTFLQQTVEQIKVIEVVVSPEESKSNHSLMNKEQSWDEIKNVYICYVYVLYMFYICYIYILYMLYIWDMFVT